jgi:hypothetical protein
MNEGADQSSPLIFDWRHRPRSAWRMALFLGLALAVHLLCFYLFTVRTPVPARAVPMPATIALAGSASTEFPVESGPGFPLAVPVPAAGLELPPIDVPSHYIPTYEGHRLDFEKWPEKPSPLVWPDISGMTQRRLPAAPGNEPSPQ